MLQIRRIQRHGNGREIRIPTPVCRALKAKPGDYLLFQYDDGRDTVTLSKVKIRDKSEGKPHGAS